MTITYSFRPSARVSGVDAQTVGEELERLNDAHGELTATLVVDAARPEDAPLHPAFEWNDHDAAELYRQHQARGMIRSIQVVREPRAEPEPVYVHVSSESAYIATERVIEMPDLFEQAYRDACDRIGRAQHSLDQLVTMAERFRPAQRDRAARAARALQDIHRELSRV